jgi:hypothetical protein
MTEATTGARPLESSTTGEQQQQQQEEEVQNDGAAVEVPASSTRWHEHVSAWRREAGMLIRWPNQQALIALACVSPLRGACFMTVRCIMLDRSTAVTGARLSKGAQPGCCCCCCCCCLFPLQRLPEEVWPLPGTESRNGQPVRMP